MTGPISPSNDPHPLPGALQVFGAILDEFPGATYACDATGQLSYFNQRATSLWGRTPRLHHPADRYCGSERLYFADGRPMPHEGCWMARAIVENRAFNGEELIIERPGGERISALAHASPIHDAAGSVVGGVNVLLDISGRKVAESERLRAQKLENLGRLAAGASHDFNNHLTVILGLASLAMEELPIESPVRPLLQQVEVAARRASGLATQLSGFAARETQGGELLDLSRVVGDIQQLIEAVATRRTRVEYDLLPARAWGEQGRIRQALMALIVNAVEASDGGGGRIRIRTASVDAAGESFASGPGAGSIESGIFGMLEVHDAGPGIPAEIMERVFEPFVTTRATGRGLGLAAVRCIVEAHRGVIRIQSSPGEGTVVRVYLPQSAP